MQAMALTEWIKSVILDYDAAGDLLGLEILDASHRVEDARTVQLEVSAA